MKTPEERKEFIQKVNNLKVSVDESKVEKDAIDKIIEEVEKNKAEE